MIAPTSGRIWQPSGRNSGGFGADRTLRKQLNTKKEILMEESPASAQQYRVVRIGYVPELAHDERLDSAREQIEKSAPFTQTQPVQSLQDADDLKLLRKAGAGDARAFHELLDHHADRLFRLAYSLLGNAADAEDVVQETFAGAYRGIGGFEGRSTVGTWLTRILVTQAARWKRDRKRPMESIDRAQGCRVGLSGKEESAAAVEKRIDLQAALEKLSFEHRQILVLREFEQMSYAEMSDVLGVPQGTVESRLHRARGELREKLNAYAT